VKKAKHILLISVMLLALAAASTLLPAHKPHEGATVRLRSPFPLAPIPRLTNEMSDRAEFALLNKSIESFLRKWHINGASLAIAKEGRLIYARGFGYANVAQRKEVQPYHLFRVASVSKLITATAVMKLVEEKKLSLSDRVFGPAGILSDSIFREIRDPRALLITVKHLLEHSGGWSPRWGDPVFMGRYISRTRRVPLPVGVDDIIAFVLSKKLHFSVGSHSSYSNVGYVMLGRVVEKVTGMPYEDYVRSALLTPMGITNMCLGNSYPKDFFRDEVSYYDVWDAKRVMAFDNPKLWVYKPSGGHNIRTLGAAGGWVASPAELVRFALCVDSSATVPDILQPASIHKMVHNDSTFDPLGWRAVSARQWLRTGTLAGTSAALVRDTSGYVWAFVTNTSSWRGAIFSLQIKNLISQLIAKESPKWQGFSHNLFTGEKTFTANPITPIPAHHVPLRP
jgi:CubicO group peptidase (beta-lactamase class C family)